MPLKVTIKREQVDEYIYLYYNASVIVGTLMLHLDSDWIGEQTKIARNCMKWQQA